MLGLELEQNLRDVPLSFALSLFDGVNGGKFVSKVHFFLLFLRLNMDGFFLNVSGFEVIKDVGEIDKVLAPFESFSRFPRGSEVAGLSFG